jgi:Xaa-Pro dipeptidase
MIKVLKVRLYPDEDQKVLLEKHFGSCRSVWNHFLEVRNKYYAEHNNDKKKGISAFDTIVCFGENSAEPHHSTGDRKLKKGDYVLMHYGAKYRDYTADTTRTAVFGKATAEQKEIYSTVYRAQSESMHMIKPGINGKLVNQKSYDIIDSTKYKGILTHGVGHGIGLDVHDHQAFGSSDFTLKENMAVTVKPGIYIPGYGGVRIEDDVLVTKTGFKLLTKAPPADLPEV